jgi:hypothetical protein
MSCNALYGIDLANHDTDIMPQQVIVKFKPEYKHLINRFTSTSFQLSDVDKTLAKLKTNKVTQHFDFNPKKYKVGLPDLALIYRIEYQQDLNPFTAADILMQHKYFEYAEPVVIDKAFATPNDSYYSLMTFLTVLNAESAWDIHKGTDETDEIVIAIVDTGVNWKHADIKDNIKLNSAEMMGITINWTTGTITGGNGIDDDGNGKIDDVMGWDFMLNSSGAEGNNPIDAGGHGSAVAGLANARTNNTAGVCSVPWNVKLMPISCSYSGDSNIYKGTDAIIYAAENGADIINYSAGGSTSSIANEEAIAYAYGLGSVIVAAAGNNNSSASVYPAAYPYVVAVGALLNSGAKASASSYGRFVDVCAPTGGMYSITTGTGYSSAALNNYTSYASPIASGLAALIKSAHPTWTNTQVVNQLISTCTNVDSVNASYINMLGDGMLNAYAALAETSPVAEQELRLGFKEVITINDANANLALERDETFSLSLRIRNYAHGVSSANVTYTLSCSDPDIIILNNTHNGVIDTDGYTDLNNVFSCRVSPTAVTKAVTCTLTVSADKPITGGSTMTFSILINSGGVFVWEGKAEAGYSGRRIRDTLTNQGHSVYYTTTFPFSFSTFSSVWLSFGMVSTTSLNVTRFDRMKMFTAVKNYLLEGGRIYIEGNDAVGFDLGYYLTDVGDGLSAADVLFPLLGIASSDDGTTNGIDNLSGHSYTCTRNMSFASTTQTKLYSMDKYVPLSTSAPAFSESDYGIVAVQNYGIYNQKSFVFSYCLAELTDGSGANKRDSLLCRIMQDFNTSGNTLLVPPRVSIQQNSSTSFTLTWDAIPGTDYYSVYASEDPEADFPASWTNMISMLVNNSFEIEITPMSAEKRFYRIIAHHN